MEIIRLTDHLTVEIRPGYARFVGDDGTTFTMTREELYALHPQLPRITGLLYLQTIRDEPVTAQQ